MVAESTGFKQAQIQRIVESKAFRTSEVQRNLLQYLADKAMAGDGETVKEYTIGLDVFGKPSSFDPRQESSVRMHVARLRQKMAEYYRTEGAADVTIVDLPKGGFKLVFLERDAAVVAEAVAAPARPRWVWPAVGFAAALLLSAFVVWMRSPAETAGVLQTAAVAEPGLSADLAELWAPFFNSPRPILVSLSATRDALTGAGTANGAFYLGQFLTPNRKREVVVTRSDQISMPEIATDNVVFVGPSAGSRQMESVPMQTEFVLDAKGIRNLKPKSGEPAFLADRAAGSSAEGTAEETFALISHVPGLYGNGEILLLEGNRTSSVMAAVKSFTDPGLARMMAAELREKGKLPHFYQVVLRIRSMDEMPVDVSYVLHRTLDPR